MARETKVGLIVGLGVILFVGVFVSDYLSVPQHQDELGSVQDLSKLQEHTTNQPRLVLNRDGDPPAERVTDPGQLAAVALEEIERVNGTPTAARRIEESVSEPPFRPMVGVGLSEELTPVAQQQDDVPIRVIDTPAIDDPRLAQGNQIAPERLGPGSNPIDLEVRIDVPEQPSITPQPRLVLHTVADGETLTAIARKHYDGDGNMWRSIRDANPGKVGPNGEVREGSELVIPKRSAQSSESITELSPIANGGSDKPARKRVRIIEVKAGQTLSAIAAEHLGSASKWKLIMDVNTDVLEKPEQLREGMRLRIPAEEETRVIDQANAALGAEAREQPAPQPPAELPRPAAGRTYTVKSGDSLSSIAGSELGDKKRYKEIYEANRDQLTSPDAIKVGMVLKLPAK